MPCVSSRVQRHRRNRRITEAFTGNYAKAKSRDGARWQPSRLDKCTPCSCCVSLGATG